MISNQCASEMMADRPADLPEYDNPPVVEVVLGIQFSTLKRFRIPHIGIAWRELWSEFPHFEDRPTLSPTFETFGQPPQSTVATVEVVEGAPFPRVWMANGQKTELIQLQQDKLFHNWRKNTDREIYPRYEHILTRFKNELLGLNNFLETNELGTIEPNQWEISYINHIMFGNKSENYNNIFRIFGNIDISVDNLSFEMYKFQSQYVITDDKNNPIGRLYVNIFPSRNGRNERFFVFSLTAKGPTQSNSIKDIEHRIGQGRMAIVRTFTQLTTNSMHTEWGRVK